MPEQPNRSWRQDVPSTAKKDAGREWRKEAAAPAATPGRWKKRGKFGVAAFSVLLAIGLLVVIVNLLRPAKPVGLLLVAAGYETNLAIPHNVYGREGLKRLASLAEQGTSSFFWGSGGLNLKGGVKEFRIDDPAWDAGLDGVQEKTVILFLALHGGVDKKGPYLLAQDADPYLPDAKGRDILHLETVLDRLKKLPDKNKILILDATQMGANSALDMFQNDFARALKKLEPQIEAIPQLIVLCSSDEDQRSWASEEWRSTIFAHYVVEGLRGAADLDGNRHVNGLELYNYLLANVQRWTRDNRNALQTPILLGGKQKEKRAEDMPLVVVDAAYQPPDPNEAPAFKAPPELDKAWRRFQELERRVPPPYAYAPHVWRKYQDTLLRFEQLVRAGDKSLASDLNSRLQALETELAPPQRFVARSLQNSLAMPAALGVPASKNADQLAVQFEKLWNAPAAELAKIWEETQPVADWQKLDELLLDRVAEDPAKNMTKARALLKVFEGTNANRPTEAHYLVMLNQSLPEPKPPVADLRLALQLRRRAERAALAVGGDEHPYSEQVFPWIRTKIEEADQQRRLGEDLLFATDAAAWTDARGYLQKADGLYRSTQADADAVRAALAVRDRAFAELPYYGQWLARRRPAGDNELRLQNLEKLWADVHQLAELLQTPGLDRLTRVADKTAAVRTGLKNLADLYDRDSNQLTTVLQGDWREVDDLLAVPRVSPDKPSLRIELLERTRQISREFHVKEGRSLAAATPATDAVRQENSEAAKQNARAQGRVAVALLGDSGTKEGATPLSTQMKTAGLGQDGPQTLAGVEAIVGERWTQSPGKIKSLTGSSRSANLTQAAADLGAAEFLARRIDGAAAATALASTANPVAESRNLHMHDLLLWQARRTMLDHWFAEDVNGDPYYMAAGKLFIEDAGKLVGADNNDLDPARKKERLAAADQLKAEFDKPVRLAAVGDKDRQITSEPNLRLEYRLQAPPTLPAGFPVIWLTEANLLKPTSVDAGRRLVVRDFAEGPKAISTPFPFDLEPRINDSGPVSLAVKQETQTLVAFYRGQRLRADTRVQFQSVPDTIAYHRPMPPMAGIAVRADRELHEQFAPNKGAITFVIDYSGSMNAPQPGGLTRMQVALNTLEKALRGLPAGVRISVWVFSQKDNNILPKPPDALPESTVQQLRTPAAWDPKQLSSLMNTLRTLEPETQTPLVRGMWEAKADLDRAGNGFRTLVVLTDGMDNRFAGDPKLPKNGAATVPQFIEKNFKDSGIFVQMVMFQVASSEEKEAKDQFRVIENKAWPTPGKIYDVRDGDALALALERATRQKLRYRLETNAGVAVKLPGAEEEGLDVSVIGQTNHQWHLGLKPDFYRAFVQTDKQLNQRLNLEKGDLLLVNLRRQGFERGIFADDYAWKPNRKEVDGWLFAVLQNQLKPNRSLQMLATLENLRDRAAVADGHLQQIHPREMWLEVKPNLDNRRIALRYANLAGFPAPAWGVDIPDWPTKAGGTPAEAAVQAWWSDGVVPETAVLRRSSNPQTPLEFKSPLDIINRDIPIGDGGTIRIESIRIENRKVEPEPGQFRDSQCLVVRVAHPAGKPVWLKLKPRSDNAGQEHHYYAQANACTAVFWDVSKAEAEDRLEGIEIYSVEAFKNARTTKRTENMPLSPPDAGDSRPQAQTLEARN